MKHLLPLGLISLFLLAVSIKTYAQKSEEEAIKKILQQEITGYFHKNYNRWSNTWLRDSADYLIRSGASDESRLIGWDAISNEYKRSNQTLSIIDDVSNDSFLNKKDFHFYFNGNVATVSFNQRDIMPNFVTSTLVKENGEWKILNFTCIGNGSYDMQVITEIITSVMGKYWMAK